MSRNASPLVMPDGRIAPSVLTWREAADLLRMEGSDETRLRRLAHLRNQGRLRGLRTGRACTYPSESVREYIERGIA